MSDLKLCKKIAEKLIGILEDVDCHKNCPLKKICDMCEYEFDNTICTTLNDLREEDLK